MAWIPSHQTLRDHPKTKKAARLLGIQIPQLIGHMHLLWWWAVDYASDGDLEGYDEFDIADAVMWHDDPKLFIDSLVKCGRNGGAGFIEKTDTGYRINDWAEYGGRYVKKREQSKSRMKKRREKEQSKSAQNNDDNARYAPVTRNECVTGASRGEERREEKNRGELPPPESNPPLIRLYTDASGETGRKSDKWRSWFDDVTGRYTQQDCITAFEKLRKDIHDGRLAGKTKWARTVWHLENPKAKTVIAIPDMSKIDWAAEVSI